MSFTPAPLRGGEHFSRQFLLELPARGGRQNHVGTRAGASSLGSVWSRRSGVSWEVILLPSVAPLCLAVCEEVWSGRSVSLSSSESDTSPGPCGGETFFSVIRKRRYE